MRFTRSSAAALAATIPLALAQTSTDCNPTEKSCPADTGLDASSYTADFTSGSGASASWTEAIATNLTFGSNGAEFTISKSGEAPTISSDFYFLFGRVDVKMQAAPGTGIISSIVFESDDLDEIDWEILGGSNITQMVETNFFGKDNTTAYDRATYYSVENPTSSFHTYTVDWNSDRIEWIIDGTTVRTLSASDPLTVGGKNYPQTPMRVKLGNWAAGAAGEPEGTVEWAGGSTDFSDAPFTMYIQSVTVTNYNPASSYVYGDQTGDWQSIQIIKGNSSSSGSASGSGSATASSAASTASAVGTSTGSITTTVTTAPTASASVSGVTDQTAAAVSTTLVSSGTATGTAGHAGSASSATTEVPGGSSATASKSSSSSSSATGSSSSSTNAASANNIMAAGSLLSVALGFFLL